MRVDSNDILRGLDKLAEEGNHNAQIAAGALNQLDYRMYEIQQCGVCFEDFCEATKISEDELNEAMGGEVI